MGAGHFRGIRFWRGFARMHKGWRTTANALLERLNASRVKGMMSRAGAIWVSLIPALFLLAAVDCFSNTCSSCGCDELSCLRSANGHSKHNQPPADNSFDQAVRRWNRRLNIQPGSDGFASPAALALSQSALPAPTGHRVNLPLANLELARSWKFRWRTALEPRAPSSVSQGCA